MGAFDGGNNCLWTNRARPHNRLGSAKKSQKNPLTPCQNAFIFIVEVIGQYCRSHEPRRPFVSKRGRAGVMVFCRFARSGCQRHLAFAHVAQLAEHVLGKDEVISSILIMGSITSDIATENKNYKDRRLWQK